jgi:hypothetical protein
MRELGIRPVLPSFNGFVPDAVARKLNEWPCKRADKWFGFSPPNTAVCHLLVTNPHFSRIGHAITTETLNEYAVELGLRSTVADGSSHRNNNNVFDGETNTLPVLPLLFSVDVFNEMDPSKSTDVNMVMKLLYDVVAQPVTDMIAASTTIAGQHHKEDTRELNAMLVMQMWCFAHSREVWTASRVKSFVSGAPRGGVLWLDLHAESRPQWVRLRSVLEEVGAQVMWNMLHNFGRSDGIGGEAQVVVKNVNLALSEAPALIKGVGVAMEGIEQNEMLYAMVFALVWKRTKVNFGAGDAIAGGDEPRVSLAEAEVAQGSVPWLRVWAAGRYHLGSADGLMGMSVEVGQREVKHESKVYETLTLAWQCAMKSAYGRGSGEWEGKGGWGPPKSVIELRPHLGMRHGSFQPTKTYYSTPNAFTKCARQLVAGATVRLDALTDNEFLRGAGRDRTNSASGDDGIRALAYDVVDFVRQAASDAALVLSEELDAIVQDSRNENSIVSGGNKVELFKRGATRMVGLVALVDELLDSHPRWREEAAWCPNTITGK